LAERSEAQSRWVQFPAGALFFVLAQGDPSSGAVYIFDRMSGCFYFVVFNDQNWGGYSVTEYEALERTHRISRARAAAVAAQPEVRLGKDPLTRHPDPFHLRGF